MTTQDARGGREGVAREVGGRHAEEFRRDVLRGLRATPKAIPAKYLYDARGSAIYDQITELDEYYPTRTEVAILERHAGEIADEVGTQPLVIAPGMGSGIKTRLMLEALRDPVGVVLIDISREFCENAAAGVREDFPDLEALPVVADFMTDHAVPEPSRPHRTRFVYFPGSTIGNMREDARHRLLSRFRRLAEARGAVVLGFDLKKDRATLEAAYDDSEGVTAEFNHNLLDRMNRELDATFDREGFRYTARWNADDGRVEMHLVSVRAQTVEVAGESFEFAEGERVHTEDSHKFDRGQMEREAAAAGLRLDRVWTDDKDWFAVALLRPASN